MNSLPDLAILAINYREFEYTWHWVVYCRYNDEQFVLDPKQINKIGKTYRFDRLSEKSC
ncbi:hypothetical protein SAMN02745781_01862 [Vibrio gazogenes DSM 21264]|uniref:Peptidase C39 family protein n=1 Tax=Vibrio gazogenes DSM 21264 = NBRC 103151 TaxID=1123492 RepID=A0A1M5A9M1_VIBGA|nr:hypothetical protein SAMN02745781_01862 [Vibrio gazogenes DSM 21264] [Vibrio gazogenes DSM 21264 = NBRC 103151]